MTLVKDGKGDFVHDHHCRYWDQCNRILWLREIGLNFDYSLGKWEFIVKERVGVSGWRITKKKHQG